MDSLLLSVLIFLPSVACILLLPYLWRTNGRPKNPKLPNSEIPGNLGLPFIGESLKFASLVAQAKLENFVLDRVTKYSSPIFQTSLFGDPVIVMHGQTANKFLFTKGSNVSRLWFPKPVRRIFPVFDGDVVKPINIQDVLRPVLHCHTALQHHVELLDRMVQQHLESDWAGKRKVCIYPLVKRFALAMACNIILSAHDEELVSKFMVYLDTMAGGVASVPLNIPFSKFWRAKRASKDLLNDLKLMVHERMLLMEKTPKGTAGDSIRDRNDDLLSNLLQRADENGTQNNETQVAAVLLVSIASSFTTPASLVSTICSYLADHPDIYRRVYEEQMEVAASKTAGDMLNLDDIHRMKYSWNMAREAMRIQSPYPFFYREVTSDFTLCDFHISKGSKLLVYTSAIHKDPRYFPEPETFDPSRFDGEGPPPYTYMPFGAGSMECPARKYAQLLVLVFIHNIIKRFRWEKVYPDGKFVFTTIPEPVHGLPVFLYPL